jgi:hypothetical protein
MRAQRMGYAFVSRLALFCATIAVASASTAKQKRPSDAEIDASIAAFNKRKIYTRLTPAIIARLPDSELEQAIVDFVEHKIGARGDEVSIVRRLPAGIRALYSTWWVEAEVNNGGFNQYFWNSSGRLADDAAAGFKLFGTAKLAKLMERAIAIHHADESRMASFKNRGTIEAFSESYKSNPLKELDGEFYTLAKNLSSIRIRFIRAHPELFTAE